MKLVRRGMRHKAAMSSMRRQPSRVTRSRMHSATVRNARLSRIHTRLAGRARSEASGQHRRGAQRRVRHKTDQRLRNVVMVFLPLKPDPLVCAVYSIALGTKHSRQVVIGEVGIQSAPAWQRVRATNHPSKAMRKIHSAVGRSICLRALLEVVSFTLWARISPEVRQSSCILRSDCCPGTTKTP